MSTPALTVLFATRDGEAVLGRTLQAFAEVRHPGVPWQMVVIDNGSRDSTSALLGKFLSRLPLEIVHHPIAGKNAALNAGIQLCHGELIVIADDDILPDPAFLNAWASYLTKQASYSLFGGRIDPYFETPPPDWLRLDRRHHALMFAARDLAEGPTEPGEIYGCNMAVRRGVFDQGFRFDERVGPDRDNPNYRMGSEVEFLRRVAAAGAASWFARAPLVRHIVRAHQWTEAAWIGRAYRCGRGRAYLMLKEGRNMAPPRVTLADRLALLLPMDRYRFPALSALHMARGFADECAATAVSGPTLASQKGRDRTE